ncbi:MAG: hypothetical protein C5B56_01800 [Proteobacteria bacterium]|nr:MAG: hypothetical protein C5B56_01800 [Pseudomonadota bacterium]
MRPAWSRTEKPTFTRCTSTRNGVWAAHPDASRPSRSSFISPIYLSRSVRRSGKRGALSRARHSLVHEVDVDLFRTAAAQDLPRLQHLLRAAVRDQQQLVHLDGGFVAANARLRNVDRMQAGTHGAQVLDHGVLQRAHHPNGQRARDQHAADSRNKKARRARQQPPQLVPEGPARAPVFHAAAGVVETGHMLSGFVLPSEDRNLPQVESTQPKVAHTRFGLPLRLIDGDDRIQWQHVPAPSPERTSSIAKDSPQAAAPHILGTRKRLVQNLNHGIERRISLRGVAHILIVDPDPAVRSLIAVALEQHGFPTLIAATAAEAVTISQSRRGRIALLIADAVMPEMGGRELANAVSEDQPGIPVVFTSAQHCPPGLLQFEYSEFLPKPFSIEAMLRKVRGLIEKVSLRPAV